MKFRLVTSLFLSLEFCVLAYPFGAGSGTVSDPNTVIAKGNDLVETLGELEQKRSDSLFQAHNAYYQSESKALDEYINQQLLERQAQRENVTVQQLLDKHVRSTLPKDPTDEALRVYYEGLDTNESYETVKVQILEHIREKRFEKARAAYVLSLRKQANIQISLLPPRAEIPIGSSPSRGEPNAPVTVIEYADYECPYCHQLDPVLQRIESDFKGKISFAFKDTPLPTHSHAEKAAEAAHCAGVQGKYWQYHDALFAHQEYDVPSLKQYARDLKLDGASFDKCLDNGEQADSVKAQLEEAQRLGLQGTPSLFVNGRFFGGILSYEKLRQVVEQELASERPKGAPAAAW